jgi:putative membrane protein insertion efficiency factor
LLAAPLIPSCCRFHPSCSHYAAEALRRYGFFKGSYLSLRRLGRCHPFNPGGWDPVP